MAGLGTIVRNLRRRKTRERRGLTSVEGIRLVEDAVASAVSIRGAMFSAGALADERVSAIRRRLEARGVPMQDVSAREFDDLADAETPQGVLAIIEIPRWTLADVTIDEGGVVLVLDGVQDPGNVGTIIRTAAGLGAKGTLYMKGTADPWAPKTLRAAMGATFRHAVVSVSSEQLMDWLSEAQVELWVADPLGEPIRTCHRPTRLGIVLGNEGSGASPASSGGAVRRVAIPVSRDTESLNVGVAAGILLYEVFAR